MSLVVSDITALCAQSCGRATLNNFFDSLCSLIAQLVKLSGAAEGSRLGNVGAGAENVAEKLDMANRTYSWLEEVFVLQAIPDTISKGNAVDKVLGVASTCAVSLSILLDHISLLKQLKILKGGKRAGAGTRILAGKVLLFSLIVDIVHHVVKHHRLRKRSAHKDETTESIVGLVKKCLFSTLVAHWANMHQMHDLFSSVLNFMLNCHTLKMEWDETTKRPGKSIK